ncbi:filamentous hemagglutinin family N-terminal domain protein [Rivularia sp. PCC 7116]|uniref:two-partner secretion domain-containing protein n=1 Tax=Rivularia sp. PCC 7116 TaxID=373994 RepID=UPI00029F48B7|nr:filamentous hemagglutinin N-terminal domain-containing protein [Rivularia sp. PCC 7116]AFY58583.1 filamentous hemagglutinin family N-terminal domain protein [Rivularia sp. PCC 7116]
MKISWEKLKKLAVATVTIAAFYPNSASAQIVKDATLPNNSSIKTRDNIKVITGGTEAGSNLFHSFEQFSVPTNTTAYFDNAANIQNIITRITGKSISNIDGILRANGTANLFLINPNGIVFGENAALDIGGSFLATTASSINFADGTKFSATQPQTAPLLTINVPTGLQFGPTAAPIRNQSQASQNDATNSSVRTVGLQVPTGKTLALIGGDVNLEGGNLTADSGRIELGSVANNSLVSLTSIDKGWALGYESVESFQNIQIIGRNIDEDIIVDVSGEDGGGSIRVQGNSVNLIGERVRLRSVTKGAKNAGDLTINARKLIVRDGAQIISSTDGSGAGGNLIINASESVEIIGGFNTTSDRNFPSGLFSFAGGSGTAGNIIINTLAFSIKDGAVISAESSGLKQNSQFLRATGEGGNITVNANESVELVGSSASFPSSLRASTTGVANAGKITISTKQLIVRDGAEISVSRQPPQVPPTFTVIGDTTNLGNAGELKITADSILLDNQGKLISETESADGGNINLQLKDLLLLRRNSQISTNAGKAGLDGDGGNIDIDIPNGFIVAVPEENSDITANAFTGAGGRVDINATGILGIQPRSRDELIEVLATNEANELNPQKLLTSDITAISQQNPNLNGELNILAQDVQPTKEVVEMPEMPTDIKVSQVCRFRRGNQSEFVFTRRGGLPPLPSEVLKSDSALGVDWIEGRGGDEERGRGGEGERGKMVRQNPIVEATGWVEDKNGDIYFVAGKGDVRGNGFRGVGC